MLDAYADVRSILMDGRHCIHRSCTHPWCSNHQQRRYNAWGQCRPCPRTMQDWSGCPRRRPNKRKWKQLKASPRIRAFEETARCVGEVTKLMYSKGYILVLGDVAYEYVNVIVNRWLRNLISLSYENKNWAIILVRALCSIVQNWRYAYRHLLSLKQAEPRCE